jgi:hypothetical protein
VRRKLKQSISQRLFSNAAQAQLHIYNGITEERLCKLISDSSPSGCKPARRFHLRCCLQYFQCIYYFLRVKSRRPFCSFVKYPTVHSHNVYAIGPAPIVNFGLVVYFIDESGDGKIHAGHEIAGYFPALLPRFGLLDLLPRMGFSYVD